jgi:hypothetical protein
MSRQKAIRHIYREQQEGKFEALWKWAKRGENKRERYKRWRALQRWAQGHRDNSHGEEREKWNNRRKAYRKQKRRVLRRMRDETSGGGGVVLTSGSPHWGGCEDIIQNEVLPIYVRHGVPITSGKRWETFGNPTSDHHMSQVNASARDAGTANNYSLRDEVMRALGVGGGISDYGAYYITRSGASFRVQPIAGTHGTGPHLHIGIRR